MDPLAHASVALMAKPLVPEAPLWALVAATQVPDALFFAFEAAGLEHQAKTKLDFKHGLAYLSPPHIPWSHGLFMSVVWSGVVGGLTHLFTRNRRASVAAGLMVVSHWLLDFTVYPNMPICFDDSQVTGLGLITSQAGFIAGSLLEVALVAGGVSAAVRHWKASQAIKPM